MKKKKLSVIIVLTFLAFALHAKDLSEQNYWDFTSWDATKQVFYVSGFMVGTYACSYLASNAGWEEYDHLLLTDNETVGEVIKKMLAWYQRTGEYDKPLFIALFRRNLDW